MTKFKKNLSGRDLLNIYFSKMRRKVDQNHILNLSQAVYVFFNSFSSWSFFNTNFTKNGDFFTIVINILSIRRNNTFHNEYKIQG